MSCFVVPNFHIDALVSWAVACGAPVFPPGRTPRSLAADFYLANCTAYLSRYGQNPSENYIFTKRDTQGISPVQIIKACDCLEYQCSDWADWAGSAPARALAGIRERAISFLPGYDKAAWTLEEVTA